MLTPELIQKFNQISGYNVPLDGTPPVISRADQIRNLAKQSPTPETEINNKNPFAEQDANRTDILAKVGRSVWNVPKELYKRGENILADIKNTPNIAEQAGGGTGAKILSGLSTAGHIAGEVAGGVGDIIGSVFSPLIPEEVKSKVGDVATHVNTQIDAIPGMTPEIKKGIADVFNTLTLKGGADAEAPVKAGVEKATTVAKDLTKIPEGALPQAEQVVKNVSKGVGDIQKEFDAIQEKIMPKPTAKEAKLAQEQGRLSKGKEPTLLKKGTPDEVIPTKDTQRAIGTIHREIPNASQMDEATLHTALKDKIVEKSQLLEPEMKKVPIENDTVQQITDKWNKLKKEQIKNADASEEANVKKLQKQFEEKLKKSKSGNMNDLWKTAKEYDDSVPESVKKATNISDPKLQYKKEMWLENRSILRDAIKDTKNGLGKVAQQSFDDMHDMYNAKEGLLSKAKVELEGKPSKAGELLKNPYVKGAIGGGLLLEGGKKLLGD